MEYIFEGSSTANLDLTSPTARGIIVAGNSDYSFIFGDIKQ